MYRMYCAFRLPLASRLLIRSTTTPIFTITTSPFATRAEMSAARTAKSAPSGPAIDSLFNLIKNGLNEMCAANEGFSVTRIRSGDISTLSIHTGRGDTCFLLSAKDADGAVEFSSPKAGHAGGVRRYKLSERTGHWACESDGHFLLDILTRDLIHAVPGGLKGIPYF
jgi:hypothetical protein